jgi:hypothetical protein
LLQRKILGRPLHVLLLVIVQSLSLYLQTFQKVNNYLKEFLSAK